MVQLPILQAAIGQTAVVSRDGIRQEQPALAALFLRQSCPADGVVDPHGPSFKALGELRGGLACVVQQPGGLAPLACAEGLCECGGKVRHILEVRVQPLPVGLVGVGRGVRVVACVLECVVVPAGMFVAAVGHVRISSY